MTSLVLGAVALVALSAIACTGQSPASTSSPSPSGGTSLTMAQMAEAGNTVFANRCAGCHGDSGQGLRAPAVIGTNAQLGKYNTAQGLLDFAASAMPMNAPGSLSRLEYQQVLAFLLLQNKFTATDTAFIANQLASLPLQKK